MNRLGFFSIACLLSFTSLGGCNNDSEYFCVIDGPLNERGCFICRGDECEAQLPPERPFCAATVDCAVGELCTNLGCARQCSEELECPIGTTCLSGLCANPTEPQPTPVSEPGGDPPSPPDDPEPPVTQCQFNFECGQSRVCVDGDCLSTCVDQPCPGTEQCIGGACRPCTDPTCLTNCADDSECGDLEYCLNFQCVPDTRPATFCPENECQPGRVCRKGQCRTPCETDTECARIDATIRFCEPVDGENLCVRSIEVLAECQLSIDCGLGDECVDATCVNTSASP